MTTKHTGVLQNSGLSMQLLTIESLYVAREESSLRRNARLFYRVHFSVVLTLASVNNSLT